jgi:hypothetical protein
MIFLIYFNFVICNVQIPLLPFNHSVVPDKELKRFKEILPYSQSTYCLEGLEKWNCTSCNTDFRMESIRLVGDFHTNIFGYVGYFAQDDQIVIAFRGTRNLKNWIEDLKVGKPDSPFPNSPKDAKIHYGFLETWHYIKTQVVEELLILSNIHPYSNLLITGHSLGGAVATLCSADVRNTYPDLNVRKWQVFTIGQPRVGNKAFAQWFENLNISFHRVVNQQDLTPHLPPAFVDFNHVGTEVYIANEQEETYYCPSPDIERAEENGNCSNSFPIYSMLYHPYAWNRLISPKNCILEP